MKNCKFCTYECQWDRDEFKLKQPAEVCPYYKNKG